MSLPSTNTRAGTPYSEALTLRAREEEGAGNTGLRRFPFRLCVGLSLLLIIFVYFDFSEILRKLTSLEWPFVAMALGILSLQFAVSVFRWLYILKRQAAGIGQYEAFSIYGFGALANLFLVTSIAGISVRAALLVRSGSSISAALASVTAERIAAIAGLAMCGLFGLAFAFPSVRDYLAAAQTKPSPYFDFAIIGMLAVVVVCVLVSFRFAVVGKFARQVLSVFSSPVPGIILILASCCIIFLGFAGLAVLAAGMGLEVEPVFFLAVMPAIAFVSALPISIGGWGVREGAMVAGLSMFSIPPESAVALSITFGLAGLFVAALLGGSAVLLGMYCRSQSAVTETGTGIDAGGR